jgi:hypothetical protein
MEPIYSSETLISTSTSIIKLEAAYSSETFSSYISSLKIEDNTFFQKGAIHLYSDLEIEAGDIPKTGYHLHSNTDG